MMQKLGVKEREAKEGKGYQCLLPAKFQEQEILSLVVAKRSKVISTKLEVTSMANRAKNNELTIGTWEKDVNDGVKS